MNENNTALQQAINDAGGRKPFADKLKITRQAVEYWLENGIPAERLIQLEEITGISRAKFRPDLYKIGGTD